MINFLRIQDIVIPDIMFNPIKIGIPAFDEMMSELGGIIPSQVTLLTGVSGSGKTTIASMIGASLAEHSNGVVFISREMSDFQLKLQARKIPNIEKMLIISEKGDYVEWLTAIADLDPLPSLIIVDSLQQICWDMGGSQTKMQKELVNDMTAFAKETFIPIIMIGHVTKDGRYMGPSGLQHTVDTHLHISRDPNLSSERVVAVEKNRFGNDTVEISFSFTKDGVVLGNGPTYDIDIHHDKDTDYRTYNILDGDGIGEIAEKFRTYHESENGTDMWNPRVVKDYTQRVINHLETKYRDQLVMSNPRFEKFNIKLTWKGKSILANNTKGEIAVGVLALPNIDDYTQSQYPKELPYMNKICQNKYDRFTWILLHEFCHLLPNCQNHTQRFFSTIYKCASENSVLFTSPEAFD